MEKFEELKQQIHNKSKEVNTYVHNFLNRENNINPVLFNDLYINCHMSREELKLLIYNISMKIIKEYNLSCNTFHKKTPDLLYAPLIDSCNQNLMIDISNLLSCFDSRIKLLIENHLLF